MTKPKPSVSPKRKAWSPLTVYSTSERAWYWHLRARNGNIVADSGEWYSSAAKARQGFRSAARLAAKALAQMEGGK